MTHQDCLKGIGICCQCHDTVRKSFDNESLAGRLHDLGKMLEQKSIQKWIPYTFKQNALAVVGHRIARWSDREPDMPFMLVQEAIYEVCCRILQHVRS